MKKGLLLVLLTIILSTTALAYEIDLTLTKTSYNINDTVEGNIELLLNKSFLSSTTLDIQIGDEEHSYILSNILKDNLTLSLTETEPYTELSSPSTEKILSLNSNSKIVAFELPEYANVTEFTMDISGTGPLEMPELDIGDDGEVEWRYLGNFEDWKDNYTLPEELDENGDFTSNMLIRNNKTYFCQVINIPFTKDILISAHYQKVSGTSGDIKAAVVSFAGNPLFPSNFYGTCNLEESTSSDWHSCEINLDYTTQGEKLVCIYSEKMGDTEEDLYKLRVETDTTSPTAINCDGILGELGNCRTVSPERMDPWIKVKSVDYSLEFSTAEFNSWFTGPDSMLYSMNMFTGDYGDCIEAYCNIPMKVTASGSGDITINNLYMKYETSAGSVREEDKFYEIEQIPAKVIKIDSINISNQTYNLSIPFSLLNIEVPSPTRANFTKASGRVHVGLNNDYEAFEKYDVYAEEPPAEGIEATIETAKNSLDAIPSDSDTSLLLQLSGLDLIISEAKDALDLLDNVTEDEVNAVLEGAPKSITLERSIIDVQLIEPNDIDEVSEDMQEEIYFMQDKVEVKATIKSYSIEMFSGEIIKKKLIKKEVTASEAISKVSIFEVISKNVADSAEDIIFSETPDIVEQDPIVKYFQSSMSAGSKKELTYMVNTASEVSIDDVKTIIVIGEIEEPEPESRCGDGKCTIPLEDAKSCPEDCKKGPNWTIMILVIVFTLLAAAYIILYRGKYSLRALTRGKMPFKNKKELDALVKYVQSERVKHVPDEKIKKSLFDKGWKQKQIKFVFDEMQWKARAKADLAPMRAYIVTAKAKGMKSDEILKTLISQGWDEKVVKKALTKKFK